MLRIISGASCCGFSRSEFQRGSDTVYGYNVNFQYPLSADGSKGYGVGSVWVSSQAFNRLGLDVGADLAVARVKVGDRYKFDLVG